MKTKKFCVLTPVGLATLFREGYKPRVVRRAPIMPALNRRKVSAAAPVGDAEVAIPTLQVEEPVISTKGYQALKAYGAIAQLQ